MNTLQQFELDEIKGEGRERFAVKDLDSANWCLRKLAAVRARIHEVNQLADAEVERINAWRQKEIEREQRDTEYFEMLLQEYHAEQLKFDPKAKTISTPYGKLKSTTRKPAPKKVDDDALLRHLKASGGVDYIKVKESPDWAEYKKTLQVVLVDDIPVVVDANGELVVGVEPDLGGTSFTVEVDV